LFFIWRLYQISVAAILNQLCILLIFLEAKEFILIFNHFIVLPNPGLKLVYKAANLFILTNLPKLVKTIDFRAFALIFVFSLGFFI
jgi:hypothetical protein